MLTRLVLGTDFRTGFLPGWYWLRILVPDYYRLVLNTDFRTELVLGTDFRTGCVPGWNWVRIFIRDSYRVGNGYGFSYRVGTGYECSYRIRTELVLSTPTTMIYLLYIALYFDVSPIYVRYCPLI